MDWQCAKCGKPVTPADKESISDATRRHSREAVHQWTGVRQVLPNGTTQRWLTPSERADRADRARAALLGADGSTERLDLCIPASSQTGRRLVIAQRRRRTPKNAGEVTGLVGTTLFCVAGLVILIGIAITGGDDEEPNRSPAELPTAVSPELEVSPSASYIPSPAPPIPLDSSTPAYTAEPGNGSNTTEGRPRETRENDGYYDGNYDNDDEWHSEYGNADEYYDGNYDNDDDYHREYGRN